MKNANAINAMKNINQYDAVAAIRMLESFKASALSGVYDNKEYLVYSYSTIIARFTSETGWELNERKYSKTSTLHIDIVKQAINTSRCYNTFRYRSFNPFLHSGK